MKKDCTCLRSPHKHGTRAAWLRDGCRCLPCRLAASRGLEAWRAGGSTADEGMWVPACGVIRRLEALHYLGWTTGDLAERLDRTYDAVRQIRLHNSPRRAWWIATRIADLYDDLWDQQPVPRNKGHKATITKTANAARAAGWAPPLAWDDDCIDDPDAKPYLGDVARIRLAVDDIAVQEAVAGRPVQLNRLEVRAAIDLLTAAGYSARETAERLGTTHRHVTRTRTREEAA